MHLLQSIKKIGARDLSRILKNKNVLIVHFSHDATMREGVYFPNDLLYAINNKDVLNLSCSAIYPGHTMDPVGSIGVIFKPRVKSIISVCSGDSGSYMSISGEEYSGGKIPTKKNILESLNPTGHYNEWRIKGAKVMGIFIRDDDNIQARGETCIEIPPGLITEDSGDCMNLISLKRVTLQEIKETFPHLKIYTIKNKSIIEL